jgi:putative transcriptional regulator
MPTAMFPVAKAHKVEVKEVDVVALRKRLGLSQGKFQRRNGSAIGNRGFVTPKDLARILLKVIDREPEAVMRALR